MAAVLVGTTPLSLPVSGRQRAIFQNLGPGVIYLDETDEVSATTGLQIPVNATYEFPTVASQDGGVWLVSTVADTDVRYIGLGA